MMNKVFVTGATGVLGKRVLKLLVEARKDVTALSRSVENDVLITNLGAVPLRADLFDPEQMIYVTRESNVIMHLATSIPRKALPNNSADWEMNDRIRIDGTKSLLKAAVANPIECFIQQSVTFVYGNKDGGIVNAETPIGSKLPFMVRSAVEMERMIRAEKSVNHVILRFGSFYSRDSVNTMHLIEGIRGRKIPIVGRGNYFWNNIHVDDAAEAIVYALRNFGNLKNKSLNFTDFSPMEYRKMIIAIATLTNSKKPFVIPGMLARLMLKKDMYEFITASSRIIKDDFIEDWKPSYSNFLDGMKQIILTGL
jgi:nucleoside-diphosphate-sugar epimerase